MWSCKNYGQKYAFFSQYIRCIFFSDIKEQKMFSSVLKLSTDIQIIDIPNIINTKQYHMNNKIIKWHPLINNIFLNKSLKQYTIQLVINDLLDINFVNKYSDDIDRLLYVINNTINDSISDNRISEFSMKLIDERFTIDNVESSPDLIDILNEIISNYY